MVLILARVSYFFFPSTLRGLVVTLSFALISYPGIRALILTHRHTLVVSFATTRNIFLIDLPHSSLMMRVYCLICLLYLMLSILVDLHVKCILT